MTLTHEQVQRLTEPFEADEHEFIRGFAYIKEEAICGRLDEVDPEWSFTIIAEVTRETNREGATPTIALHARMTVGGVTRDAIGMASVEYMKNYNDRKTGELILRDHVEANEAEKSADTDALKRCARKFGIGRYLTNLPRDEKRNSLVTNTREMENWLSGKQPSPMPQKQAPQGRQDAPATPKKGDKRTFAVTQLETAITKDGKPYYRLTATDSTEILTFSRELFRAWGWADELVDSMQVDGFKTEIEVELTALATPRKDGKGLVWMAVIPEVSEIPF